MATSIIPRTPLKTAQITVASSATQDEFFKDVANAVASVSAGDIIMVKAIWSDHDVYIGIGVYIWGAAYLLVANSTYIYRINVNTSAQTISFKRRIETTAF